MKKKRFLYFKSARLIQFLELTAKAQKLLKKSSIFRENDQFYPDFSSKSNFKGVKFVNKVTKDASFDIETFTVLFELDFT